MFQNILNRRHLFGANFQQGSCPGCNGTEDGYLGRAPARSFPRTVTGLNMAGNFWQWCADWTSSDFYRTVSLENPESLRAGTARASGQLPRFNGATVSQVKYVDRLRAMLTTGIRPYDRPGGGLPGDPMISGKSVFNEFCSVLAPHVLFLTGLNDATYGR